MDALATSEGSRQHELICLCAGVSRVVLDAAIARSANPTIESLGAQLGCGLQCGCCRPLLQEMLGLSPWHTVVSVRRQHLVGGDESERPIVRFDLALEGAAPYPRARPGQHVVVQAWLEGAWITRTYTVVQQSDDGNVISIAMRRLPEGVLTRRLIDADLATLAALSMRVAVPSGHADPADGRAVVCFAAGVGVTLAMSLLTGRTPGHLLHIDYCASTRADLAFIDVLEREAAASNEVTFTLRATDTEGHITESQVLETVNRFADARCYVCGPQPYTRHLRRALRLAHVPSSEIRIEAFFLERRKPRREVLRRLAYAVGLAAAVLPLWLLSPAFATLVPNAAHNPGHETLACEECHRPAQGSVRQQVQAKVHYLLGLRERDVDFGMRNVANAVCTDCHANPDDRHPAHRFLEPKFAPARAALAPQYCASCHREHTGVRVSQTDRGFCAQCHADVAIAGDPVQPTHAVLAQSARWDTCLSCHDFHGNHAHRPPDTLDAAIDAATVARYLGGGNSPYGAPVVPARKTRDATERSRP
jgi:predicted CXXCH cytochrome family protein